MSLPGGRRFGALVWAACALVGVLSVDALAQCAGPMFSGATKAPSRPWHSVAYDSNRQRLIMFGGDGSPAGQFGNETWAFDGQQWSLLSPPQSPPGRQERNNLVYDSARDRLVLFGGSSSPQRFDTWEFDGTTWAQRVVTGPAIRGWFTMAYDAARQRTVLFGGETTTAGQFASNQTWLWDGNAWSQASPATSPPPLKYHMMAYDPVRQKVVVWGGALSVQQLSDQTWEWNGTTWARVQIPGPPAAGNMAMAWDGSRQRIVLAHMEAATGPECWEYDGAAWTFVANSNLPCISGQWEGPAAFHAGIGRLVLTLDDPSAETTTHFTYGSADPPRVLTQPVAVTVGTQGNFTLSIESTCQLGRTYRWRQNGVPLNNLVNPTGGYREGSTTSNLSMGGTLVNSLASGWYDCVVTTNCGTTISDRVLVNVTCDPTVVNYETPPLIVQFILSAFDGSELGVSAAEVLGTIGVRYDPNCGAAPFATTAQLVSLEGHATSPITTASWTGGSITITGLGIDLDTTAPLPAPARINGVVAQTEPDIQCTLRGIMQYNAFNMTGTRNLADVNLATGQVIATFDGGYGPNITVPFDGDAVLDIGLGPLNPSLRAITIIRAPYPHCAADVDNGTRTGIPDLGVTIDDLLYYLQIFESGSVYADLDDGSGQGVHDGGVTIDDLIFFLVHFESGC